jgi:hypothetical protein
LPSKINFLISKYSNVLTKSGVENIPDLVMSLTTDVPSKYHEWVIVQYSRLISDDNLNYIKYLLCEFEQNKNLIKDKDINHYKTIASIEEVISQAQLCISKKDKKKQLKSQGVEIILSGENFKVLLLLTPEAAELYSKNTKWCTNSATNNFYRLHSANGSLYLILAKHRKFQLHFEAEEFKNEADEQINSEEIAFLSEFPEYKIFLEMLIHKKYL